MAPLPHACLSLARNKETMGCVGYMAQYQAIVWTVVSARSSLRLAVFLQYVLQRI